MSPASKSKVDINRDPPLEEIARLVCSRLEADGISVVLSGGAAVSIYSENEYESYDLDFIPTGLARRVDRTMEAMGFERRHPVNLARIERWAAGERPHGAKRFQEFRHRLGALRSA